MLMYFLFIYLFCINVIAFCLYAIDKHLACYNKWRIPEFLLLTLAVVGGAYGAGVAMLLFRHKTKHPTFLITVPLCFLLWMIALVVLCLI